MKKILSLDGGGIRGMIPALILSEIEKQTGKAVSEIFDLVAGTSTGGILAAGLNIPDESGKAKYSAQDLADLYDENGKKIFSRSFWKGVSSVAGLGDEKYSAEGIESVLEKYFGNEVYGKSLSNVLISSYDIEKRSPYFFKSWREEWKNVKLREICRATSAAPTYFEPAKVKVGDTYKYLIDGGVFINNPAMSAYAEAKRLFPDEEIMILSIGTGQLTRPVEYEHAKNWGKLEWLIPLLSCMFDGVSDAVDYQLENILGDNYFRLQTSLHFASDDMDNASNSNILSLKHEAEYMIENNKELIHSVIERLIK